MAGFHCSTNLKYLPLAMPYGISLHPSLNHVNYSNLSGSLMDHLTYASENYNLVISQYIVALANTFQLSDTLIFSLCVFLRHMRKSIPLPVCIKWKKHQR
jgi:hypothetical protein